MRVITEPFMTLMNPSTTNRHLYEFNSPRLTCPSFTAFARNRSIFPRAFTNISRIYRNRLRMSPNPQAPGYKERIRLRKGTILHPTDFGQIIVASSLPLASNNNTFIFISDYVFGFPVDKPCI